MPDPDTLPSPQPFYHLLHRAREHPLRIALVSPTDTMTFSALLENSQRVAQALRERGVVPGDLVITDLNEHLNPIFMEALFHEATIAAVHLGPLDPANPLGIDWLVAHRPTPDFPADRTIIVDDAFFQYVATLSTDIEPQRYESFDSLCRLVFSSGTTGEPHALGRSIADAEGRRRANRVNVPILQPTLSLLRFTSSSGFATAYGAIAEGDPYFTTGSALESIALIKENYVASVQGSPAQVQELLDVLDQTGTELPDLAHVLCGGSFVSPSLANELKRRLGVRVFNVYGATECGFVSITEYANDSPYVGRPFPQVTLQVVDPDGHEGPFDVVGEIRYQTTYMARSLFPHDTAEYQLLRDGWFYPGDLGFQTEDGRLLVTGRTSELINAGGVKLRPELIDEFVSALDGVIDAAAFAVESLLGVTGYAVAVVANDECDVASLSAPIAAHFQGCAPTYLVRVDAVRRNVNGKALRAEMANDLMARLAKQKRS